MQRVSSLWRSGTRGKVFVLVGALLGLCVICAAIGSLTPRQTPSPTAGQPSSSSASQSVAQAPATIAPATQPSATPKLIDPPKPTDTPKPTNTPAPSNTPKPTDTPKPPPPTATSIPTIAPQELKGQGQQAAKVTLQPGLVLMTMTYTGQRNFIVELLKPNGQPEELPANVIGAYNGSRVFGVTTAGDYGLNINASGPWTIRIEQPRPPADAATPPQTLSGKGPAASPFLSLKGGLITFKLHHTGSRNFIVTLLNAQGQPVDLLTNVIGPHEGSKNVGILRGAPYILDIQADGDWSIEVTQ